MRLELAAQVWQLVVERRRRVLVAPDAELEQGGERLGEVVEEELLVLCVALDPRLEGRILAERLVCRQHHQGLAELLVVVLERAVPLAGLPIEVDEHLEVVVREARRVHDPWPVEA